MFIARALENNPSLLDFALRAVARGDILPDSYVIDLDSIRENAKALAQTAASENIALYFMLKQLGRNPLVAKALLEAGLPKAVCVDFQEALHMMREGIPIGHLGNLVQTPKACLESLLSYGPEIVTVFSIKKAREIHAVCRKIGRKQDLMLRVYQAGDALYSSQEAGFLLEHLDMEIDRINRLSHVQVKGVCSFPSFRYNAVMHSPEATQNVQTIQEAAKILEERTEGVQVNMPSMTCCDVIPMIKQLGGTHGEPGHALSGTTPLHADKPDARENLAYVYVSEISHHFKGKAYAYGGGWYRRGHMQEALVGDTLDQAVRANIQAPTLESIDYYLQLQGLHAVSKPVVMAFRAQMFTSRSEVVIVDGLQHKQAKIVGVFSALGNRLRS